MTFLVSELSVLGFLFLPIFAKDLGLSFITLLRLGILRFSTNDLSWSIDFIFKFKKELIKLYFRFKDWYTSRNNVNQGTFKFLDCSSLRCISLVVNYSSWVYALWAFYVYLKLLFKVSSFHCLLGVVVLTCCQVACKARASLQNCSICN